MRKRRKRKIIRERKEGKIRKRITKERGRKHDKENEKKEKEE